MGKKGKKKVVNKVEIIKETKLGLEDVQRFLEDELTKEYIKQLYYRCYDISCEHGILSINIISGRKIGRASIFDITYNYTVRSEEQPKIMDIIAKYIGRPLNNNDYIIYIDYNYKYKIAENVDDACCILYSENNYYNSPEFHKNKWVNTINDYDDLQRKNTCEISVIDNKITLQIK